MSASNHLRRKTRCGFLQLATSPQGAQLAEFAISLPLLVVFVVGIFDFSSAFTLKQKLTNLARDVARAAAGEPANDLASAVPVSINDAYYLIHNYLLANNINDCALALPTGPSGLTWKMTGTGGGCPSAGLTVIVNRGYYFPANVTNQVADANCVGQSVSGTQTMVVATCVMIQYPYEWRFGKVVSLLGRNAILPTTISAEAVAMNEN